jgi:hypothetical protein
MFKQIYKYDDWGNVYYTTKKLLPTECASSSKNEFKAGESIQVKFKNGSLQDVTIVGVIKWGTVSDMGKSYGVKTIELFIKIEVFGHTVLIPLEELKVER